VGPSPRALSAELGRESSPVAAASSAALRPSAPGAAAAPAEGDRRITVGVGFTDDPDAFLIGGDADFYQSERLAIGPSLQFAVDDGVTIFAPSFHGKLVFPLEPSSSGTLMMPFVQGGAGIAYIDKDRGNNDEDDWGFLLQAGGGLEVRFDEKYALATTILVNLLPGEVTDEGAYLSWQIVQFSFTF
jgi:hypothetical protein